MQQINKNLSTNSSGEWYKKWWGILIIVIGTLILINLVAFGFYVNNILKSPTSNTDQSQKLSEEALKTIEGTNSYWTGSVSPKVTIVEFSDFACPYCKKSFQTIREIGIKYKDDVKIIYRDMPLQDSSLQLAMAGQCAGEQGLFWLMHDKLFQNQGLYQKEDLSELANQIGADIDKFNNCLNSNKYLNEIQKNITDGEKLEIRGTPTWFINGYKIEGDVPYNKFIEILEKFLKE